MILLFFKNFFKFFPLYLTHIHITSHPGVEQKADGTASAALISLVNGLTEFILAAQLLNHIV